VIQTALASLTGGFRKPASSLTPLHMRVGVWQGMWVKGLRQGQGEMTWSRSGQSFKGEFYAGLRHGFGVCVSPITGITFEGEFRKGQVHGAGTLIITDHKTKKQRRVRRGLWHKSDFAPAGFLKMKDLVHIIDKVGQVVMMILLSKRPRASRVCGLSVI